MFDRHAQRSRKCLEHGFALMMRVVAPQVVDMQRCQRVIGKALKEFVRKINIESANHRARKRNVPLETGSTRQVDDNARQCFVERNVGMSVTAYARLVAERLSKCLTEADADVFDRVVAVDVKVAARFDRQIKRPMTGDLFEHVIEEANARGKFADAAAVKIDGHTNLRFPSVALDFSASIFINHIRLA